MYEQRDPEQGLLPGLDVGAARPSELGTVLAILDEAGCWLQGRGIQQWRPGSFPTGEIEERIRRGEVYLAWADGEPAATLTIQWEDPAFWGDVPRDAAYVHRLAVRRARAGRGLGHALLAWAEGTARAAGMRYLRLDCAAENAQLRAYYEAAGFERRGELAGSGWATTLYEKSL